MISLSDISHGISRHSWIEGVCYYVCKFFMIIPRKMLHDLQYHLRKFFHLWGYISQTINKILGDWLIESFGLRHHNPVRFLTGIAKPDKLIERISIQYAQDSIIAEPPFLGRSVRKKEI